MGMYDNVLSSYNLGEHFTNIQCQTKDIEYGYGGTMSQYWISPNGCLYLIDYSHTADFIELKEGDEGYNDERPLLNFTWIPNGTHGKVTPWILTKYIKIYPEKWSGEWEDCPRCKLHFRYGVLQDYETL